MKRVCKPNGKILLMECGLSNDPFLNKWIEFSLPMNIHKYGFFNNRDWN